MGEGPFRPVPFPCETTAFYWSHFFEAGEFLQKPTRSQRLGRESLKTGLVNLKGLAPEVDWESPLESEFQAVFQEIQQLIQQQKLKKVVPVVFESTSLKVTPEILAGWIDHGLSSTTSGTLFGHWNLSQGRGFLGLTPELLFSVEDHRLKTMALAGTAASSDHRLLQDAKETAEHQFVVEALKQQLLDLGELSMVGPYEWSPGALTHLRTDFTVDLQGQRVDPLDLVRRLHPTPALGGSPRQASWDWLREHQGPVPRGPFGAPFGCLSEGRMHFVVGIRCLFWNRQRVFVGSGCGIVEGSQRDREWQELKNKRAAVKQVFGWE